ncbi:MAG: Lrp/AsnC family transcriptional regulator [Dehalococcoidia bacterium]|nr:MAG: Lrp/AsnC family transcriptional regulator [Dehalococcoidia bacterium]
MRTKKTKFTDEELVSAVGSNARISSEKLAKKLKVSPTTIRRRLKSAMRKDIMRTFAVVDPDKAGLTVQTVLGINLSRENIESVINALENRSEIKWLAAVTGEYDIIARAAFSSIDQLSAFLEHELSNIKGINNCESFVCLDIPKGRFIVLD